MHSVKLKLTHLLPLSLSLFLSFFHAGYGLLHGDVLNFSGPSFVGPRS